MARFANPHKFGAYHTRVVAAVVHERTLWADSYLNYLPSRHRLHADVEVLIVCVEELRRWIRRVRNAAVRHAASL
jgi:hypothetical protein